MGCTLNGTSQDRVDTRSERLSGRGRKPMPGKLCNGKRRRAYKFIKDRSGESDGKTMCRLLKATRK